MVEVVVLFQHGELPFRIRIVRGELGPEQLVLAVAHGPVDLVMGYQLAIPVRAQAPGQEVQEEGGDLEVLEEELEMAEADDPGQIAVFAQAGVGQQPRS